MIQDDGSVSIFDGTQDTTLSASGSVPLGSWVQLVFVFTGDHVSLYVNGALQHTVACAHDFAGHPFILGRGLRGEILNVDFWLRTLKPSEIEKLPRPVSAEGEKMKFVVHSPEARYEMALTKEEDLTAQEKTQKASMQAAEKDVKAEEKERTARELRTKQEMKAEKQRRDELAAKDKANQESEREEKKAAEAKELKSKSDEQGQKDEAQAQEASQKDARKEKLAKDRENQKLEEKAAAEERAHKSQQRAMDLETMKADERKHKTTEKNRKTHV